VSIEALSVAQLTTTVGVEGGDLVVALSGNADLDARTKLAEWLRSVHEEVLRLRIQRVVVDLRRLEFMNSLCLNAFVGWLATILELSIDRQYRVHFLWNRDLFWQRKSLSALCRFALRVVTTDP
jgi:anti-anti-sigma factor